MARKRLVDPFEPRRTGLLDLYESYREDPAFEHLRSYTSNIRLVEGEGSVCPRILVVGEAPGATENVQGRPFVGASGRVIRSMMAQIGLSEKSWFITNVVKYRPPGNRAPTPEEIEASRPYLRREWKILGRPKVIVTAGATALTAILSCREPMGRVAGVPHALPDGKTWLYPMFHPAFALRDRRFRPEFTRHWEEFSRWLDEMKKEGLA